MYKKVNSRSIDQVKKENVFLKGSCAKDSRQIHETKQTRFSYEMLMADLLQFCSTKVTLCFLGNRLCTRYQIKKFEGFYFCFLGC